MMYGEEHPVFHRILEDIFEKSPMQRKFILKHIQNRDKVFWQRAERFSRGFLAYLNDEGMTLEDTTEAYLKLCGHMVTEQIKFKRTGRYTCNSAKEANAGVYGSEKQMIPYVLGLAISQFLWPNHYDLFDFFVQKSRELGDVESYLEVGPGHGLYMVEALGMFPGAQFHAVDISPISTRIAEGIVRKFGGTEKCLFEVKDVNDIDHGSYDYIVMCEVLEHLDNPRSVMTKIGKLLKVRGHAFVTTCANCPAIDHVYLYRSVEQIREEIREAGLSIVSDLALAVEDLPEVQWVKEQVEVNYGAMLQKAEI